MSVTAEDIRALVGAVYQNGTPSEHEPPAEVALSDETVREILAMVRAVARKYAGPVVERGAK